MDDRVETCFRAVPQALNVVREIRDNSFKWKGRADPLSAADEASTEFIVAEIRRRFPGDEIICEDAPDYPGDSGYTWVCDPLDGTLNYIRGAAPWAVSLGLLRGREIIAGCVAEGTTGNVFTAELGGGAQRNEDKIQVSKPAALNQSLIGFDCPYDDDPRRDTTLPAVEQLLLASGALRCYGSCALALCLLAAGDIDAYAVEHGKPWDFAAGTLIAREALGTVTTWAGAQYDPMRNVQVLATNTTLHNELVKLIGSFDRNEIYGPGARGKAGELNAFWLAR